MYSYLAKKDLKGITKMINKEAASEERSKLKNQERGQGTEDELE